MVRKFILIVAALLLVWSGTALAGGKSATITVDQANPAYDTVVTYTITGANNKSAVETFCTQGNGTLVFDYLQLASEASSTGVRLGTQYASNWLGGPAKCYAILHSSTTSQGRLLAFLAYQASG